MWAERGRGEFKAMEVRIESNVASAKPSKDAALRPAEVAVHAGDWFCCVKGEDSAIPR